LGKQPGTLKADEDHHLRCWGWAGRADASTGENCPCLLVLWCGKAVIGKPRYQQSIGANERPGSACWRAVACVRIPAVDAARMSPPGGCGGWHVVWALTRRAAPAYAQVLLLHCSLRSTAALRLGHISSGTESALRDFSVARGFLSGVLDQQPLELPPLTSLGVTSPSAFCPDRLRSTAAACRAPCTRRPAHRHLCCPTPLA
jgi:hypothetical protein